MKFGYETADCANYKLLKEFANENRAHPTPAESLLWSLLSGKTLGVRFRQQHIIGDYIADFVCLQKKLIIELDGGYHSTEEQILEDGNRTQYLNALGFDVVRFSNEEVIGDTEIVIETIRKKINEQ